MTGLAHSRDDIGISMGFPMSFWVPPATIQSSWMAMTSTEPVKQMVIWWSKTWLLGGKKWPGHVFFWWLNQGPKVEFFVSFVETRAHLRFSDSLTWITGKYWEQIAQNTQNLGNASCPNFGPTWPAHPMSYPPVHFRTHRNQSSESRWQKRPKWILRTITSQVY